MRMFSLSAALVVATVSGANADTLWSQQIVGWYSGAYARYGTFSHCAASVPYKSGILLLFSINNNLQWSMGLINPAWNLSNGSTYNIQYNVDLDEPEPAVASTVSSHFVEIGLRDAAPLFNRFKAGKTLYIHAQNSHFQFNLTNSSKILDFLLVCAKAKGNRTQIAGSSSNPFAASPPQAKPDAPKDRSAERSEAMILAANLVSAMGISGVTFLKPAEIPASMAVDAAWKGPSGLGGVAVLPGMSDPTSITANVLSYDAKHCKSLFASGTLPAEGEGSYQQLFTKCGQKDAIIAYYLIVPRQAGGNYVISTYTKEGFAVAPPKSDADVRAAAFKVIPK
jgi:hypothetical protein